MALTDQQKYAVNLLVSDPTKTQKQVAEEIGVHYNTVTNWNKNKEYVAYKNEVSRTFHDSFKDEALRILRDKALDPKSRSHFRYLEMMLKSYGELTDKQEVNATVKEEKSDDELLEELKALRSQ
ncbi:phBC6A51 family helix-turn-helix protein [Geomicrobium sp. JCM 19055]|uniref:phBC6A51 family helix-turn-helix protein n=1 Tax=Geomicrobium sp. JCM 19055 TaxID=1460649 RepID=UPI00045ECD96|nr:phBC6A51 family helix-turn-helix protein [Geomicrobium sp. JCM 19055]GAK00925.1 hypothetical protein JCM19055_4052 [Geomicrobium sp. JCM 19055]